MFGVRLMPGVGFVGGEGERDGDGDGDGEKGRGTRKVPRGWVGVEMAFRLSRERGWRRVKGGGEVRYTKVEDWWLDGLPAFTGVYLYEYVYIAGTEGAVVAEKVDLSGLKATLFLDL